MNKIHTTPAVAKKSSTKFWNCCVNSIQYNTGSGRQMETKTNNKDSRIGASVSASKAILFHLICGVGLASAFCLTQTLSLFNFWVLEAPIVIFLYSLLRPNPNQCSYLNAVGRGLLALPAGAVLNALGAIALGAPVGIQYSTMTLNWSLLMSVFTFVPLACCFGSSWSDWQRLFAHTKPTGPVDYMICLPAHGAVIGAWLGAWPMPLDWERSWQEWPICVSYGAVAGYLVGMVVSSGFILFHGSRQRTKGD